MNKKELSDFLKLFVISKEKVGFASNIKIPTIKKAVELLNSIGVLKLTAINFKKQI